MSSASWSSVLLEPEQEELLKALVEATRNVPRNERQKLIFTQSWGPRDRISHPGLPGQMMGAYEGDLDVLEREGLLNVSYTGQRGNRFFDVGPLGFRFYEEMQRRLGTPAQQVEEGLKRYLETDAFQQKYPAAYRKWAEAEKVALGQRLRAAADDDRPSVPGGDAGVRHRARGSSPATGRWVH